MIFVTPQDFANQLKRLDKAAAEEQLKRMKAAVGIGDRSNEGFGCVRRPKNGRKRIK